MHINSTVLSIYIKISTTVFSKLIAKILLHDIEFRIFPVNEIISKHMFFFESMSSYVFYFSAGSLSKYMYFLNNSASYISSENDFFDRAVPVFLSVYRYRIKTNQIGIQDLPLGR